MKKSVCLIIILFAVCANLFVVTSAYSLDFIIGVKSGYYVWVPYFREWDRSGVEDVDRGSGVLYGPVISVLFTPDISLSTVVLTGKQSTYWTSDNQYKEWMDGPSTVNGTYYFEAKRTDIDSALSYRISKSLKLFAGYKYQHLRINLRASVRSKDLDNSSGHNTSLLEGDVVIELPAHGPALGAGYSHQLGNGYFITSNLSAIYLWSRFHVTKNDWNRYTGQVNDIVFDSYLGGGGGDLDLKTEQVGLNLEPSIGVKVGERMIYTLGFRYQWMATRFKEKADFAPEGWMHDYVYGVYVSVLFII